MANKNTKKIRSSRSKRNWNTKNYYLTILRATYNPSMQDAIEYRQRIKAGLLTGKEEEEENV